MTTNIRRRVELINRLQAAGFTYEEANKLRRIEMTLQRWGEAECGDSNDKFSRCLVRDEETNKPYWEVQWHTDNKVRRTPTADREAGALKRLEKIIGERNNRYNRENGDPSGHVIAYHQSDPRGCALYIVKHGDLNGSDINSTYTRGIAVCD